MLNGSCRRIGSAQKSSSGWGTDVLSSMTYAGRLELHGEPPLVLRAFGRTGLLQPGASELVQLDLSAHDLAVWDERGAGWLPATGEYVAHVGASSRDLRLGASFEVVA